MRVGRLARALAAGALAALACACAFGRSDFVQLNSGTSYKPRPENAPVVLSVGEWEGPYEELGVVRVSGLVRAGYADLNDRLRDQARNHGADAVIFVHYGTENVLSIIPIFVSIPWDVLTAEGLAIKAKRK